MSSKGGRLAALLDAGEFVVTSEVVPPRSGDGAKVREGARGLVGYVDAVNVTDNPSASPHMSPLAGARFVHEAGAEPTLQLVCRDRNRLGDHVRPAGGLGARREEPAGPRRRPDGRRRPSRGEGRLRPGTQRGRRARAADPRRRARREQAPRSRSPPRYLIGVADVPLADAYDPAKLEAKLDAGGDVVWTQIVYDVDRLGEWADLVRPRGVFERAKVIVGLVPLRSVKNARFLDGLYGVHVPQSAFDVLERAGDDAERAGVEFTIDVVQRIRAIDGVSGLHLLGIGRDDLVRAVVERAGLFPRPTIA